MTEITASLMTLFEQGSMSANEVMLTAVEKIDNAFGNGYAKKNPELVAAFMQAAITDSSSSVQTKIIGEALERIAGAVEELADKP